MSDQGLNRPTGDVDVVIPLYNNGAFIEAAIRSVLEQTVLPRSVIVVDDGSTDDGAQRVREIIARGTGPTRLVYFHQPNAGPNSARDHGLRNATATYVAFLDADDQWMPGKLEHQLACFRDTTLPDLVLVHCGAFSIDEHGNRTTGPHPVEPGPIRGHVFERLLIKNRISGGSSGVLIKRACFDAAGSFDTSLRTSEDYDMWLRISQVGSVDHVPLELVGLRDHGGNNTKNALHMLRGMLQFNAKWFAHADNRPEVLQEWGHLIALFASRSDDRKAAIDLVNQHFDRDQQRALFARAFGSLRLYILLKRLRAFVERIRP